MHILLPAAAKPNQKQSCSRAKLCFSAVFLGLLFLTRFCYPRLALAQTALSDSSMKGKVIDLGDGNPWLVVQSAAQTGTKAGYVYIMAMHNYGNGTWGSDNANPTIAISRLADDGTGVLYNSLPATIGGVAKATALGSHNWQWDICSFANPAVCSNTVASTSRLSFVSYREWQGGTGDYLTEPTSGSVGNLFCAAWKGTVCIGSNIYTSSNFNYPWSRSGYSSPSNNAWFLMGRLAVGSLSGIDVSELAGSLPVAWLQSSITAKCGAGTFVSPYQLDSSACNTTPTITIANPAGNPWRSNVSGYTNITVSGNVTDPDNQTQAIQYSIDGGAWTAGQNLAAGTGTRAYSFTVNVGALTEGNHNVKTRTYDGTAYSTETGTLSFRIDKTNPTFTLSPSPTGTSSYLTSTALSITGSDASSGVAETRYSTTDNLNSTCTAGGSVYSSAVTLSAGTNNIYVCVRDNAGNVSTNSSAHNEANVYQINKDPEIIPPIGTLSTLTQGEIIQIEPVSGAYMCEAQTCDNDGEPAEPYKLMYSGLSDGSTRGFIMVDNYCAWRSADCTYAYNNSPGLKFWSGTSFNSNHHNTTYNNDLGGGRQSQHILIQLDNFYNSLPSTIGGMVKDSAIPLRVFDIIGIPYTSGTGAISTGDCQTSTDSTPFGNIQATFVGTVGTTGTCTMTSRVSLPSYEEWLGGLYGYNYYPSSGALGYAFCQARFNTDCTNGGSYNLFSSPDIIKGHYSPWLRSPRSGVTTAGLYPFAGDSTYASIGNYYTYSGNGVLPWLYIDSSIPIYSGQGTYADPYSLEEPSISLTNTTPNIGAYASYVSGFNSLILAGSAKDEDIGQTLTIQYQIDGTGGAWSNLTTVVADGTNQNWSGTITLPAGLTDGTHTVYVRVYDGYGYSGNKTASFYLDDIPPANTASLVGGVLCTGIPTIYCTAPTGISLTSSDLTIGLDAYRTQWDTTFASGDITPSWTAGAPPSNLSTTGHTTSGQTHTLYYQTRDKLGNASAVESISYYVNSTPEIVLNDANHSQVITPYTPLVLSGTFTDLDPTQSVTIKATIDGIDYVSPTYPTTSSVVAWEIVIPASSLQGLSPPQLTNFPLTITDSAGVSSSTYYTGQITLSSSASSEIYLSVMRNIPFSLTIGKVGAINVTFGTTSDITVSTNSSDEIIVSGSLSSPASIPFGITTLVFTILDEPSTQVQKIEFI